MTTASAVLVLIAALVPARAWWTDRIAAYDLQRRLHDIVALPVSAGLPCPWHRAGGASSRPLTLLVMGQSNAANHGAENEPQRPALGASVTVTDGRLCWRLGDPLPGATGRAHSIWSRLEQALAAQGVVREVVVMVLAVDSSTIADWTLPGSPLAQRLHEWLPRAAALPIDFVLWQQGESDARAGTRQQVYAARLQELMQNLRRAGIEAPMLIASSTRCRNLSGEAIREASRAVIGSERNLLPGPDTDALAGDDLRDRDCHFTAAGLDAAAQLWARALGPHLH